MKTSPWGAPKHIDKIYLVSCECLSWPRKVFYADTHNDAVSMLTTTIPICWEHVGMEWVVEVLAVGSVTVVKYFRVSVVVSETEIEGLVDSFCHPWLNVVEIGKQ